MPTYRANGNTVYGPDRQPQFVNEVLPSGKTIRRSFCSPYYIIAHCDSAVRADLIAELLNFHEAMRASKTDLESKSNKKP